jgi:hypothetical protein
LKKIARLRFETRIAVEALLADHRTLKPVLMNAGTGYFAVLDGAQFNDLPALLFEQNFIHRPLYLDRGNGTEDQLRAGPQLVWLDRDWSESRKDDTDQNYPINEVIVDRLFDLLGERPAAVFWQCNDGGDRLYRHLRGINKVLYPEDHYLQNDEPIPESGFDMVVFRHADSNVMAHITPALSWQGLSRLLGPAAMIVFSADKDWSEKPMRLLRDAEMPPAPTGPLKIGREEIRAIELYRRQAITRQRIAYLQKTCPQETAGATPEALADHIRISHETGQKLGLVSEAAHCRWAYLMVATKGEVARSPEVATYIRNGGANPDEQVGLVMKSTIAALKQSRNQMGSAP